MMQEGGRIKLHVLIFASGLLIAAAASAQPAVDIRSADGRLTHVAWKPPGTVERWIVSLHGTRGVANRYAVAAIDDGQAAAGADQL